MNIQMAGIDHSNAAIDYRELFALTHSAQIKLMKQLKETYEISGCVAVSTCNRTEIWISYDNKQDATPYEMFCTCKGIDTLKYREFFVIREGADAVRHLFETGCGLKSKVFGEEQIITQINESIALSREIGASDAVLETLFRNAVTAAKKVKTDVRLIAVDRSVAHTAADLIQRKHSDLDGAKCIVIGNGEMGRLTAQVLMDRGYSVCMTLRQYKNGKAIIPTGCTVIDYDARIQHFNDAPIIISATTSPHYTIHYEDVKKASDGKTHVLIDLAVPRDIDPNIGRLEGISLYDIDSLGGALSEDDANEAILKAQEILAEYVKDFENWYQIRTMIPKITQISEIVATDVENRIKKSLKQIPLEPEDQTKLCQSVNRATYKAVEKIMIGLRKTIDSNSLEEYISSVESAATVEVK